MSLATEDASGRIYA